MKKLGQISVGLAAAGILFTVSGCGSRGGGGGAAAPALNKAVEGDLKMIGLAYQNFYDSKKAAPKDADELQPFLKENPGAVAAMKDGRYVVIWNVDLRGQGPGDHVLGYEKDAPAKGGAVLFTFGNVEAMSADAFKKAALAKPKS